MISKTMSAQILSILWTNIWITDDLTNADATGWNNTLINAQPDENCDGGSENILGLVSGANVYVANTRANGARNGLYGDDIHIHAHIIAFNESFSVQYWQNTISNPAYCSDPPYGDGQGENIENALGASLLGAWCSSSSFMGRLWRRRWDKSNTIGKKAWF